MTNADRAIQLEETRQQWKEHIRNWKQSGINQSAYCRKFNLIKHRFTYWKRKFDKSPDFALVPMHVVNQPINRQAEQPIGLFIGNKYKINVHDKFNPDTLRQVLVTV